LSCQTKFSSAGFTIGICASDSARNLPNLLSFLLGEEYGDTFALQRIVVVASGCSEQAVIAVSKLSQSDSRILLITEPERRGKAEAIGKILQNSTGGFLAMLNADASPERGAIRGLLAMASEPKVGAVSAEPVFDTGDGPLQRSLALMWSAHSRMSLLLNHAGISNHASDELLVIRRRLVPALPANVVNDGAFMGGLIRAQGYLVKFSTRARVRIEVPRIPIELIRQRRRIIFGHFQVWKRLGKPPRTIESMMLIDPLVSLRTFIRTLSTTPQLIKAIPIVIVVESVSVILGLVDTIRSTDRHRVWKRNAD
jgi:cellulose synthase/poly-beta-1,6-N-acetylglucosamine synthase-like glycosyltransferase